MCACSSCHWQAVVFVAMGFFFLFFFLFACVPDHDWMFQHVHVLGWDISVVKHTIIMGWWVSKAGLLSQVSWEWCERGTWWLCGRGDKTRWCHGFFDDVKRLFESITGGCIAEVSSSKTPIESSRKPPVLPVDGFLLPISLGLVYASRGKLPPFLAPTYATSWMVAPVSLCCLSPGDTQAPGRAGGWSTPSVGHKTNAASPVRGEGDSKSSGPAT